MRVTLLGCSLCAISCSFILHCWNLTWGLKILHILQTSLTSFHQHSKNRCDRYLSDYLFDFYSNCISFLFSSSLFCRFPPKVSLFLSIFIYFEYQSSTWQGNFQAYFSSKWCISRYRLRFKRWLWVFQGHYLTLGCMNDHNMSYYFDPNSYFQTQINLRFYVVKYSLTILLQ